MGIIKPLIAGNWKMNGTMEDSKEIISLIDMLKTLPNCDVMICPPATLIQHFNNITEDNNISIGAQDCHFSRSGANTGDISALMLKDAGAKAIIVGHSERRCDHGETNKLIQKKAQAVNAEGMTSIICVGESEKQYKDGQTVEVIKEQLAGSIPETAKEDNTIIAYEPVWAIGTGLTPTINEITSIHSFIRELLQDILGIDNGSKAKLLYGGSVKPRNAAEILAVNNVNGALVGGASLKADDFYDIIKAA